MKKYKKASNKEHGFVMIASLLILLVLTIVGIAVNKNTTTEWQIAMNDRLHKETFYLAESATELAFAVSVDCVKCDSVPCNLTGNIGILDNGIFSQNYAEGGELVDIPDDNDDNRDIVFPAIFNGTVFDPKATNEQPHANINVGSDPELTEGSAIQMAAGYEGLGKGLGSNTSTIYHIKAQQIGKNGSVSVICAQYRYSGRPWPASCN